MTMADAAEDIVDWPAFKRARQLLGTDFERIVGYFREDGEKAVAAIEDAIRKGNAAGLVLPAHTLKGDSAQVGATRLAEMTERFEMTARRCVETHDEPSELITEVIRLRPLFRETLAQFERELSTPVPRRGPVAFGRKQGIAAR